MRSRLGSLSSLSLGSVNLALLSFYFFPVWGRDAVQALLSPYNGLNDRVHATATIYFSQLFDLSFGSLVVASHVLAGVKLVIAAAFVAYIIEFARSWAIGGSRTGKRSTSSSSWRSSASCCTRCRRWRWPSRQWFAFMRRRCC